MKRWYLEECSHACPTGQQANYRHSAPTVLRWFKKKLPRSEASALLRVEQHEGSFLVRESESKPGEYSLSVR